MEINSALARGRAEGEEVAINLLKLGSPPKFVARATNMGIRKIKSIAKRLSLEEQAVLMSRFFGLDPLLGKDPSSFLGTIECVLCYRLFCP